MEITTKFNLGDLIHFINNDVADQGIINKIDVSTGIDRLGNLYQDVSYNVNKHIILNISIHETKAFQSKDELIASL